MAACMFRAWRPSVLATFRLFLEGFHLIGLFLGDDAIGNGLVQGILARLVIFSWNSATVKPCSLAMSRQALTSLLRGLKFFCGQAKGFSQSSFHICPQLTVTAAAMHPAGSAPAHHTRAYGHFGRPSCPGQMALPARAGVWVWA